jgi:hypothetical protein
VDANPHHRWPYVGEGADGARRSAQIDREEADTLPWDDPRRVTLQMSAARWNQQAAELERQGAAMSEQLTAAEYREALQLVLAELYAIGNGQGEDVPERLGRLQVSIETVTGASDVEPIAGLRVLRRAAGGPRRVSPEASDRALRLRQETSSDDAERDR